MEKKHLYTGKQRCVKVIANVESDSYHGPTKKMKN